MSLLKCKWRLLKSVLENFAFLAKFNLFRFLSRSKAPITKTYRVVIVNFLVRVSKKLCRDPNVTAIFVYLVTSLKF